MNDEQIKELTVSKQSSTLTSFYSTASGYITELNIKESDYVAEGGNIVSLANLSTLWAEAQVYTSQLPAINKAATASVQVPDMPGKEFTGAINFINQEINPETRINLIRINFLNERSCIEARYACPCNY